MKLKLSIALIAFLTLGASFAVAGIVNDAGTAAVNPFSTAVGTGYEAAGMQYVGTWGAVAAVIVSPTQVLTIGHYNYAGIKFNSTYAVESSTSHGDLRLVTLSGANFANYATIFTPGMTPENDEVVITGNGYSAGTELTGKGWIPSKSVKSLQWGTNTIEASVPTTFSDDRLMGSDFDSSDDASTTDYEYGVTDKDSGGGIFRKNDQGEWCLTGVNYSLSMLTSRDSNGEYTGSVETFLSTVVNAIELEEDIFVGGIYDADGLYAYANTSDTTGTLVDDPNGETTAAWSLAWDLTQADAASWLVTNIDYTPAPEPATMSLLALGGIALLRQRRQRRRK